MELSLFLSIERRHYRIFVAALVNTKTPVNVHTAGPGKRNRWVDGLMGRGSRGRCVDGSWGCCRWCCFVVVVASVFVFVVVVVAVDGGGVVFVVVAFVVVLVLGGTDITELEPSYTQGLSIWPLGEETKLEELAPISARGTASSARRNKHPRTTQ